MNKDSVIKAVSRFSSRCAHSSFLFDPSFGYVTCAICSKHLDPMWVIGQFCNEEERMNYQLASLEESVKKTKDKLRCKCEHCGKITKIVRER